MKTSAHIENILKTLPDKPGVYQYYDDQGQLLYIGKAKVLKNRVTSYFSKIKFENAKTFQLVKRIADIKFIVVANESDALLLENSLIKKFKPKYNIALKDDRTYPSIVIKNEKFPRVFATRKILKDGSTYLGPFTSVKAMHQVLELAKTLYPIRTCNLPLNQENIEKGKFRVCLEYHIGNCMGPCDAKQSQEDYDQHIFQIKRIIRGYYGDVLRDLKQEMLQRATALEFEAAQKIKEKIEALESFQTKNTIVHPSISHIDVFTMVADEHTSFVNYLQIMNGTISIGYNMELKKRMDESDAEVLAFAVTHIRDKFQSKSIEVLVPFEIEWPWEKIKLTVPLRGDKRKLLELSERNAKQSLLQSHKQIELTDPARHVERILSTLQKDLHLTEIPRHIECFDNSNIQGTNPVSACVVFKEAKASKKDYRIFNVKTVQGPDDFATMREAIFRRYHRVMEENEPMPQLIIIDGGKGQLSAAMESLAQLQLVGKVAVIGIAKKLEEIYFPGDSDPLYLDKRSESLKLIQQLRDEAHRFGLSKHRNRRSKEALQTELTQIPGLGIKSAQKLLIQFGSVDNIKAQSIASLTACVSAPVAKKIHAYFHATAPAEGEEK
ncbi:MAG: UvrABC system protein [Bacteroidota bacterium]